MPRCIGLQDCLCQYAKSPSEPSFFMSSFPAAPDNILFPTYTLYLLISYRCSRFPRQRQRRQPNDGISDVACTSQEPHGQASTRGRKRQRMAATTAVSATAATPTASKFKVHTLLYTCIYIYMPPQPPPYAKILELAISNCSQYCLQDLHS